MNLLPVFSTPTPAQNTPSVRPADGATPQGFEALLQGLAGKSPSGVAQAPGAEAPAGEPSAEGTRKDEADGPMAWAPTLSVAQMLLQAAPVPTGQAPADPAGASETGGAANLRTPVLAADVAASPAGIALSPAEIALSTADLALSAADLAGSPAETTPSAADVARPAAEGSPAAGRGGSFQQVLAQEGLSLPGTPSPAPVAGRSTSPTQAPRDLPVASGASAPTSEPVPGSERQPVSGDAGTSDTEPTAALEPARSGFAVAGEAGADFSGSGEAGTRNPQFATPQPQAGEGSSAPTQFQEADPTRPDFNSLVEKATFQPSDSPDPRVGADRTREFPAPAPVSDAAKPEVPATPTTPVNPSADPIPVNTVARAVPAERVAETARAWARQAVPAVRTKPRTLEIQLDPPRLGRIRIEVSADESGAIKAVVQVENRQAQGLLEQQTSQLQQRLAEAGVHLQEFSLGGFGSQADHPGRGPSQTPFAGPASSDEPNLPQEAPAAYTTARTGLLNLRV